jgi:hypothetical protein
MSESLTFALIYEDASNGWTMIAEVPQVITQGATVEEAQLGPDGAARLARVYVRDQGGGRPVEVPLGARKGRLS